MSTADSRKRPPVVARRVGYAIAAAVNLTLIYLVNGWPGWEALPFLTGDTRYVLPLLNLSLAAGVVVNVVQLAYDPPRLVAAGGVVTTGIGLAVLVRMWQVFPFDFDTGAWRTVTHVLPGLAIAGTIAGLVVQALTSVGAMPGGGSQSRHA